MDYHVEDDDTQPPSGNGRSGEPDSSSRAASSEEPLQSASDQCQRAPTEEPDFSVSGCTAVQSPEPMHLESESEQRCLDPHTRHTQNEMVGEPSMLEAPLPVNPLNMNSRNRRQSTSERKKHQYTRSALSSTSTSTVNSAAPTRRSLFAKQSTRRSTVDAGVVGPVVDEQQRDRTDCGSQSSELELWREVSHIRSKMAERSASSSITNVRATHRDIDQLSTSMVNDLPDPPPTRRQEARLQSLESSSFVSQYGGSTLVEARSVNVNDEGGMERHSQNGAEMSEVVDATPLKSMFWHNASYALLAFVIVAVAVGVSLAMSDRPSVPASTPTSPPSMRPTLDPMLRTYQNQLPDYSQAALDDPQSPQSRAFKWLGSQNEMLSIDAGDKRLDRMHQQYSLTTFFFATGGDAAWIEKGNWLNASVHECDWFGCNCTDERAIHSLVLNDNRLDGTLPRELSLLSKLRRVDLSSNAIRGRIPSEIGLLTDLTSLGVHINSHSGSIPDALGALTRLETLHLHSNPELTGQIPTEIGQFAELKSLYLDNTGITGAIPTDVGGLSQLEEWSSNNCALNSTIPTEIGGMVRLRRLDFHSNRGLIGPIPLQLGLLLGLEYVTLDSCSLSGTIPSALGMLTSLKEVNISNNDLTGTVPSEVCNLLSSGLRISVDPEVLCDCGC